MGWVFSSITHLKGQNSKKWFEIQSCWSAYTIHVELVLTWPTNHIHIHIHICYSTYDVSSCTRTVHYVHVVCHCVHVQCIVYT